MGTPDELLEGRSPPDPKLDLTSRGVELPAENAGRHAGRSLDRRRRRKPGLDGCQQHLDEVQRLAVDHCAKTTLRPPSQEVAGSRAERHRERRTLAWTDPTRSAHRLCPDQARVGPPPPGGEGEEGRKAHEGGRDPKTPNHTSTRRIRLIQR